MKTRIKNLIIGIIGEIDLELQDGDNLYEKGITSINMMAIMGQIEDEFDIEIPEEDLELDSFKSINHIYNLVNKTLKTANHEG